MTFNFGLAFQQSALRLMIEDEPYCSIAAKHFRPDFFDNVAVSWIFAKIQSHWNEYERPPTMLVLYEELRTLDPLVSQQYQPTLDAIAMTPAVEADYIGTKTVDFIKRNLLVERFEHTRSLYNSGTVDDAYDFWQRAAEEIQQVDLGAVDRSWFFDEFEDRQRLRKAYSHSSSYHTFSTGIPDLDDVLNGGLSVGELGMWMAYPKIGKSLLLAWLAFWAVRSKRVPTLVTVHEGGIEYWMARLDACFARAFVANVARGELTPETHRSLVDEYRMLRGLLVLRGYTKDEGSWNATVLDIATEMKELKQRHGFTPKMVVVDYVDLLRSRDPQPTETAHQTAATRDLKTLATRDDGYAIWSAAQAQRKNPKADTDENFFVRTENVADAYAKIRIPDFVGSINRTAEEEKTERARLLAEVYRSGAAGRVIEVKTDYASGRFVQSILGAAPRPEYETQNLF